MSRVRRAASAVMMFQIGTLLGRIAHPALGEQFGEHPDGRQRRLQFMRHVADEISFLPRQFEF